MNFLIIFNKKNFDDIFVVEIWCLSRKWAFQSKHFKSDLRRPEGLLDTSNGWKKCFYLLENIFDDF